MMQKRVADLGEAYERQLDEVGQILVRAGVLQQSEIDRQGVRFAVRDRFEPRSSFERKE